MTTKAEQAEAERKVMARLEARLSKAYFAEAARNGAWYDGSGGAFFAAHTLKVLRASAAALYPGRQNRRHLLPALGKMVTAACRVIRGGAK